MTKDWVNLAVVGTGRIYNDAHRHTFAHPATNHIAVVGLCDMREKLVKDQYKWLMKQYKGRLKQAQKKKDAPNIERIKYAMDNCKIYTSYDKMLDELEGKVDVLDNATHGRNHIPLSVQAMERKMHAMAEKPPGLNWMDVKRVVRAEEKTKKNFHLLEHVCYERAVQKMRQVIISGQVGTIQNCKVQFGHGGPYVPNVMGDTGLPHFIDPLLCGGGTLQDLGPHGIARVLWPLGPGVKAISCQTRKIERRKNPRTMSGKNFESKVDDYAEALLECYDPRTKSNFKMDVTTSWCGGYTFPFDIETDKGNLNMLKGAPCLFDEDGNEKIFKVEEDPWEPKEAHIREIQIFCKNIQQGKPSETGAEFALRLEETISLQYFAKLMKKKVTIEEMDAWGEQIVQAEKDEQKGIDAIVLKLLSVVDLL